MRAGCCSAITPAAMGWFRYFLHSCRSPKPSAEPIRCLPRLPTSGSTTPTMCLVKSQMRRQRITLPPEQRFGCLMRAGLLTPRRHCASSYNNCDVRRRRALGRMFCSPSARLAKTLIRQKIVSVIKKPPTHTLRGGLENQRCLSLLLRLIHRDALRSGLLLGLGLLG